MTDEGQIGVREVDLNISMGGREAFMREVFKIVPPVERIRVRESLRGPVEPTYPNIDNQDMINIFDEAARPFGLDAFRDWIVPAKLEHIAVPSLNRSKPYTGPKIEDLPGLKPEHKGAILALINPTRNRSRHNDRPYPGKTNQDILNLIFRAALPFTDKPWENWIVPAGLDSLAIPRENRGKPYTGSRIENLPALTAEQKDAILALL